MDTQDNIWSQLYQAADEFFALQPWKIMYETDIFGVRSPDTGKEYFISIMGSGGQSYSLVAYEGSEALSQFWNLQTPESTLPPGYILRIPHLMLSLSQKDMVDPKQLEQMKSMGRDVTKKLLPEFTKMTPGFFPHKPGKEDLNDLLHILKQSIHVVKKAIKEDKNFLYSNQDHEEDYLFRIVEKEGASRQWKEKKLRVEPPSVNIDFTCNTATIESFMQAPENKNIIQVDLQFLQTPIDNGEQPLHFPLILMAVDAKNGDILFYEMLSPLPDYQTMLSTLPEIFMQKAVNLNQRQTRIKYRHPDLDPVFKFLSDKTGIKAWHSNQLKAFDIAFEFIDGQLT